MRLKRGVITNGVQPPIWFALGVATEVFGELNKVLIVTSLADGHADKPRSLHHKGLAADLRTRDLKPEQRKNVCDWLAESLDHLGFDVVLESDHIHIEYDPKQGEKWLTETA